MKVWWSASELAEVGLPDVPDTVRGVNRKAKAEGWPAALDSLGQPLSRQRQGRGGGVEYHHSVLPIRAQIALTKRAKAETALSETDVPKASDRSVAWAFWEDQTDKQKQKAKDRLSALDSVEALVRGGLDKNAAVGTVAVQRQVSARTIWNWYDLVAGKDRADWLPSLAPRHMGRVVTADCDPAAWEMVKADYLRGAKPPFTTCFERVSLAAQAKGWKVPSERTLFRRIETEIPKPVRVLLRDGPQKLQEMYPPQERDRSKFHALEAVNVDGHTWDVFVEWPDGTKDRPVMAAIQDLHSNKVLAWRIDRSENSNLIRLCFRDVFERYGIPEKVWMDNGRGFAAKCISGGVPNRYRFKVKADEPSGILTQLGVQIHWATPYHGQAKPIERAFRDLCDSVAKHPAFEGAYTGNKPTNKPHNYGQKAVPLDAFLKVVEQGIRLHNGREKRRTRVCGGVRSFDQAFAASYGNSLIRKAGAEQLRMCLLAAEAVPVDRRHGTVRFMGNRYFADELHEHMGGRVVIRFDPDNLHQGVDVHQLDGRYIARADCLDAVGFENVEGGREQARIRKAFMRKHRELAELEVSLNMRDLARLIPDDIDEITTPEPPAVRLVSSGNAALKPRPVETVSPDAEESFDKLGALLRSRERAVFTVVDGDE